MFDFLTKSFHNYVPSIQLFEYKEDDVKNLNNKTPTLKRVKGTAKVYEVSYKCFNEEVVIHVENKSSASDHQTKTGREKISTHYSSSSSDSGSEKEDNRIFSGGHQLSQMVCS